MNEEDLDIDSLISALDNDENESIVKLNSKLIKDDKNNILQKLQLERESIKLLHKKLKHYRYVDEIPDLHYGSYIRWIPLKNPEKIYLTNGGIICDMKVEENGIHIMCKNNMNRLFQLNMEENLIFQKFSDQEEILLKVLDHLSNE
jgi:hypothetical protein